MKIRCKNCYRVLDPKEEYCKSCGEHSEQMKKAMETGNYGGGPLDRFKIAFALFAVLAFLGNGIIMTIFAVIKEDASSSLFNKSYSLLFSSIVAFLAIFIIHIKDLKDFFWNGNKSQFINCFVVGTLFIIIATLCSLLTKYTRVLPLYATDYLSSGTAKWFSGPKTNISVLFVSFILVALTEEIVFRRLLIDALDDATMLGDTGVIIVAGLVGTIMSFSWIMSVETLIVSFVMNLVLAGIYANSNRSLGLNVLLRVLIIVIQFLIFYV